ncbi:hypothetical protein PENSPDRAFT_646881 [Peniophora sp. CONT]|nr:hypothetical protein PENSPDRAFT_646881 [Peniophora sp. CONT]
MPSKARSPSIELVYDGTTQKRAAVPTTAASGSAVSTGSSGSKRKSTGGEVTSAPKRKKTTKESDVSAEKKDPAERWKWIDRARPEFEFKGTKIEAFNCGGTFFKSSAKTVADRLDKLESFLAECDGDETAHPSYGYPERFKPKRVARKKGEPVDDRWHWLDLRRPEVRFKGTKIECYNCGGIVFRATGKTVADRLDKLEQFFAECKGDETNHRDYGNY